MTGLQHTVRWAAVATMLAGCAAETTNRLSDAVEARFAAEGILFRAADQTFRFTSGTGSDNARWEERMASIVVTPQSLLIHKNDRIGIEITPSSRRFYQVNREGTRIRLAAGSGKSRETWSFEPPDSADAWTVAIRAVIRGSRSVANP